MQHMFFYLTDQIRLLIDEKDLKEHFRRNLEISFCSVTQVRKSRT